MFIFLLAWVISYIETKKYLKLLKNADFVYWSLFEFNMEKNKFKTDIYYLFKHLNIFIINFIIKLLLN
jgi:hypothetical protein